MGSLENYLPKESGTLKYIIFKLNGAYFLRTDSVAKMHLKIADDFFKEKGIQAQLMEILTGFNQLGGLGGGFLEWDPNKKHIIYHSGSAFGPPKHEDIDKLMKGSKISYDTPLDEFVEKETSVRRDRFLNPFF